MRVVSSFIPTCLGQGVIIDKQPGASTIPGTQAQDDDYADGCIIGMNNNASFILRPLVAEVSYP